MFHRVVLFVLFVVSLFAFAPTTARASEAPAPEIGVAPDVPDLPTAELPRPPRLDPDLLRVARRRWGIGLTLGLIGTGMGVAGTYVAIIGLFSDPGLTILGAVMVVGGVGLGVVGAGLSISGGFAHAGVLRRGGLDVSMGLAVASLVTPLACVALGLLLGGTGGIGAIFVAGGFVSAFALSGAQLAFDAHKIYASGRVARGPAFTVAPVQIGKSPGIAVTGRW